MSYQRDLIRTFFLVSVTFLAGCAGDMRDLQDWVVAEKSKKAPPIEPLPEIKPYETFAYNAEGLRDPFRLGISTNDDGDQILTPQTGPRPDPNRRKEVLESYPLDSLSMVGTFYREPEMWGLVLDPEGLIHRIKPENYLGQNHGRIMSIDEGRIELIELIPNGLGGYQERRASIALGD